MDFLVTLQRFFPLLALSTATVFPSCKSRSHNVQSTSDHGGKDELNGLLGNLQTVATEEPGAVIAKCVLNSDSHTPMTTPKEMILTRGRTIMEESFTRGVRNEQIKIQIFQFQMSGTNQIPLHIDGRLEFGNCKTSARRIVTTKPNAELNPNYAVGLNSSALSDIGTISIIFHNSFSPCEDSARFSQQYEPIEGLEIKFSSAKIASDFNLPQEMILSCSASESFAHPRLGSAASR